MLSIVNNVFNRVKENEYVSKSNEMISIAKTLYQMSKTPSKDSESEPWGVKYLEKCYMTAVEKVTDSPKEEVIRNRWDVMLISTTVQKAETLTKTYETVSNGIQKKVEAVHEKVKWTRRTFDQEIKKRAKTCEKVRKAFVKRVKSQGRKVEKVYNFTSALAKSTIKSTTKKTAELRIKLHKKVDSLVTPVKPYYVGAKKKLSNYASHSYQTASDLSSCLLENSLEYVVPIKQKTIDVFVPYIKNGYQTATEKIQPVKHTMNRNKQSMFRFMKFTWELVKDAFGENLELGNQFYKSNQEHLVRYFGDADLEIFYAKNKSFSLRDVVVEWFEVWFGTKNENQENKIELILEDSQNNDDVQETDDNTQETKNVQED